MYHDYLERDGRMGRGDRPQAHRFQLRGHRDNSIWALFVDPEYEGLRRGKKLLNSLQIICLYAVVS